MRSRCFLKPLLDVFGVVDAQIVHDQEDLSLSVLDQLAQELQEDCEIGGSGRAGQAGAPPSLRFGSVTAAHVGLWLDGGFIAPINLRLLFFRPRRDLLVGRFFP